MQFYVYTLAYPDGKVFYVGKGQGDRINHHEREASSGKKITNKHKVGVIRKIWAVGGEVVKDKLFETQDEQEALYMEREYITYFGRANLTNLTDGGDGTSGYRHSQESRDKMGLRWSRRSDREKEAALERRTDNWWTGLRGFEKYVMDRKEPFFDRISRTKLYPTYWEEPEGYRVFEEETREFIFL